MEPVNTAPEPTESPVSPSIPEVAPEAVSVPETAPVPVNETPLAIPAEISPSSPEISPSPVPEPVPEPERLDAEGRPIAYTLEDSNFGTFDVLKTDSGWWANSGKVQKLIDAYKIRATDEMAWSYAGITYEQLRYFNEVHPDFSRVKAACKELLKLAAMNKLAGAINSTSARPGEIPYLDKVLWFLERSMKDEFSTRTEVVDPRRQEADKLSEDLLTMMTDVRNATVKQAGTESAGGNDTAQEGSTGPEAPATVPGPATP